MKDALGTEIKADDYLTYATRVGNSAHLLIGRVLEVSEKNCIVIAGRKRWNNEFVLNSKKSVWSNEENTLVVPNCNLDIKLLKDYFPDNLPKGWGK